VPRNDWYSEVSPPKRISPLHSGQLPPGRFNSSTIVQVSWPKARLASRLLDYARTHLGHDDITALCFPLVTSEVPFARPRAVSFGSVYLLRGPRRRYKIGRTNAFGSPGRTCPSHSASRMTTWSRPGCGPVSTRARRRLFSPPHTGGSFLIRAGLSRRQLGWRGDLCAGIPAASGAGVPALCRPPGYAGTCGPVT